MQEHFLAMERDHKLVYNAIEMQFFSEFSIFPDACIQKDPFCRYMYILRDHSSKKRAGIRELSCEQQIAVNPKPVLILSLYPI